ncbi:diguanylate cyclase with PAS/PAC sensor [Rhodopseudomonas palustris TIE-1]|uniref:GGDEF domain-containing protein n=1 Tax=Rhodopseudomonas palustris TaxID=1076 RepID=UPI0001779874|nr:diguanylate cyclase [Rhodopseudomonas palustris]ACF02856.1 diguanylate cyclase with PAS/PAC sensor [Rhodopseudomonas palustris TIE-1]
MPDRGHDGPGQPHPSEPLCQVTLCECLNENALLAKYAIDRIADMIIWLDEHGRVMFVNAAATKLLGYSQAEFLSMTVLDLDPLFDADIWRDHWREVESRGSFTLETVNRTKDGVDVAVEVTVNFVECLGRKMNCSIVRDITERKRAAEQLAEMHRKLVQANLTDELTAIANRRRFDGVLSTSYATHMRSGAPLSLILLDIDHFKAFNDRYGHLEGDRCLQRIAEVIDRRMFRAADLAARWGGEEFVCILPDTDEAGALAVATALREAILDLAIPHEASPIARVVTASLGVVTATCVPDKTAHSLFETADALLYEAKNLGRNRIVRSPSRAASGAIRPD